MTKTNPISFQSPEEDKRTAIKVIERFVPVFYQRRAIRLWVMTPVRAQTLREKASFTAQVSLVNHGFPKSQRFVSTLHQLSSIIFDEIEERRRTGRDTEADALEHLRDGIVLAMAKGENSTAEEPHMYGSQRRYIFQSFDNAHHMVRSYLDMLDQPYWELSYQGRRYPQFVDGDHDELPLVAPQGVFGNIYDAWNKVQQDSQSVDGDMFGFLTQLHVTDNDRGFDLSKPIRNINRLRFIAHFTKDEETDSAVE